jgi:hypothetical protein
MSRSYCSALSESRLTGLRSSSTPLATRPEAPTGVGVVCRRPVLDAAPAAVVIIDGIEMDGEPAGANGAGRSRSGRVPDGHVLTGSLSLDESDDSGAKREFGIVDVVDEHVVASSQGVPLELQHHAARRFAPIRMWWHGSQRRSQVDAHVESCVLEITTIVNLESYPVLFQKRGDETRAMATSTVSPWCPCSVAAYPNRTCSRV